MVKNFLKNGIRIILEKILFSCQALITEVPATPKNHENFIGLMMKNVERSTASTWVEINLSHLKHNFRAIQQKVKPDTGIMAVVKADAYGHGLIPVARELAGLGVSALGVGSIEEGIRIREKISPAIPVFLLLGCFPEEVSACLRYNLTPLLYSLEVAERLDREARRRNRVVSAHLKVDTGMGRLGVPWTGFQAFLSEINRLKHVRITGLTSHFGQADLEKEYNRTQWKRFSTALKIAHQAGLHLSENHMANSAALLYYKSSHLHYVRPGILLYGSNPNGHRRGMGLKPVMTLKSRILQVKEVPAGVEVSYGGTYITSRPETLAIIPVGYANGYPRLLSNRSVVLIRGKRFPLIGRVCMNLIVVGVDKSLSLQAGEEVVLMGCQGQESVSADELASQAESISYELFCILGRMNARKYVDEI
jgi:alanine racemase